MSNPVIADLLARIEELERAGASTPAGVPSPAHLRRSSRRRRLGAAVLALTALLAIPVGAFASHQFTDVPNSNTFHSSISKVKLAGITAGCSSTKFCPNDEVTRGQMAAFLARTAGRAEFGIVDGALLDGGVDDPIQLTTLEVKAGEATGGTAYVSLVASVTAYTTDVSGCPCTASFYIISESLIGSWNQYATLAAFNLDFEGTPYAVDSTTIATVLPIPTGVTETMYLVGYTAMGDPVSAYGEMTAEVNSFDGVGNNVPSLSGAGERRPGEGPAGSR